MFYFPAWNAHFVLDVPLSRYRRNRRPKQTPRTGTRSSERKLSATDFPASHVTDLESSIDAMDVALPPLTTFILPSGGGRTACALHVARATCRRAERRVHEVVATGAAEPEAAHYMNRLSDWLFTAARYASMRQGRVDVIYRRPRPVSAAAPPADAASDGVDGAATTA